MQAVRPIRVGGDRCIALFFLDHALEGSEGLASRPDRSLPPGKAWYPLNRRLGGPLGRSGEVRKISPPTGIRSRDRPARSVVAIPTELSRPTLSAWTRPFHLSAEVKSERNYTSTYSKPTPWSRVLEKLTGFQLVKKFPSFYGTQKFITAFTNTFVANIS